MLTKAQNKYIRSLTHQKYRKEHNAFIAEGDKIAAEWLASAADIEYIVANAEWADRHAELIAKHNEATVCIVKDHELEAISALQTPNQVLLVVHLPADATDISLKDEWAIALDDIRDPGNMGTIIRIADWFGINKLIISPDCVDVHNPKVVQSAMGGHLRVSIHTAELDSFIQKANVPVYAATLDGENIYNLNNIPKGIILIGNESRGVSEQLMKLATKKITIPRLGGAESLNAAVSAGIICALLLK